MRFCEWEKTGGLFSVCKICGAEDYIPEGLEVSRPCSGKPKKRRSVAKSDIPIPEPIPIPETDCVFRGEFIRLENCKPCQSGGTTPRVFACGLHGECVLHSIAKRKGDGSAWAACSICPDRLSPENGNGRNGADDENQHDSAG